MSSNLVNLMPAMPIKTQDIKEVVHTDKLSIRDPSSFGKELL